MIVLNLVDLEKSDIKYKINKFPDGQQSITIINYTYEDVLIKSRLNNFQDLELIICAVKSLREFNIKIINLYVPFFLGSRSDRKFQPGECNYLKDVICPIINSLNLNKVTVLDAHSDVLEACLNNYVNMPNYEFVKWALKDINNKSQDNIIFCSPDGGALKKIYKVSDYVNFTGEIITCSKTRDTSGKLTNTKVPDYNQNKDLVIIDDICDGGATFTNIAEAIVRKRNSSHTGKIYLLVTHGIFSKGFDQLMKYFDGIYCTNSYRDLEKDFEKAWLGLKTSGWVHKKQLDIFK